MNHKQFNGGKEVMECCLLGKVLGTKSVNREAFEEVMNRIWSIPYRVRIDLYGGDNRFVFCFATSLERQRVYSGGPWLFDRQVIVFVKPSGIGETSNVEFNKVAFWIHIINVPLACLNESCARFWGKEVGELLVTVVNSTDMKVRVLVDVTKPLKRGIRVFIEEIGAMVMLLFQYEFLPDFCFRCGVISHRDQKCTSRCNVEKNENTRGNDHFGS